MKKQTEHFQKFAEQYKITLMNGIRKAKHESKNYMNRLNKFFANQTSKQTANNITAAKKNEKADAAAEKVGDRTISALQNKHLEEIAEKMTFQKSMQIKNSSIFQRNSQLTSDDKDTERLLKKSSILTHTPNKQTNTDNAFHKKT